MEFFYVCLEAKSPIHIGCGEGYDPISFSLDRKAKCIRVFDPFIFISQMKFEDREELIRICQKGTADSLRELYKYMAEREVTGGRVVPVSKDFIEHFDENPLAHKETDKREGNKFEIERTAFNPVDNRPYIPGSSIKGAIRTAYLNYKNKAKQGIKEGSKLENYLLGRNNIEDDPFRLLRVSDFLPVGEVKTKIQYALNKKKKISKHNTNAPFQILEVIEPGALFLGSISINLDKDCQKNIKEPIDLKDLQEAIKFFFNKEITKDITLLRAQNIQFSSNKPDLPIKLGKHSGAESVTVDGYRSIMIKEKEKSSFKDHTTTFWCSSDYRDKKSDKAEPFAWVNLEFIDDNRRELLSKKEEDWKKDQIESNKKISEELEYNRLEREKKERERKEQEKAEWLRQLDLEQNPWKKDLPALETVKNWGDLAQVISSEEKVSYIREQKSYAQAVIKAVEEVYRNFPKKWNKERDALVCKWFEGSEAKFESKFLKLGDELDGKFAIINSLKDWAHFEQSNIDIDQLGIEELRVLQSKLRDYGCCNKKVKNKKKWETWVIVDKKIRGM